MARGDPGGRPEPLAGQGADRGQPGRPLRAGAGRWRAAPRARHLPQQRRDAGQHAVAAVRAGSLDVLLIRDTVFEDGEGKAAILSGAGWTGLEDCHIGGGAAVMVEGGLRAVRNPRRGRVGAARLPGRHPRFALGQHAAPGGDRQPAGGDGLLLLNGSGQEMRLAEGSRAARCAGGQPRGSLVVRLATIAAIGLAGPARARPGGAAGAARTRRCGDGWLRPRSGRGEAIARTIPARHAGASRRPEPALARRGRGPDRQRERVGRPIAANGVAGGGEASVLVPCWRGMTGRPRWRGWTTSWRRHRE